MGIFSKQPLQRLVTSAPRHAAFWWAAAVVMAIIGLNEYSYYNSSNHLREVMRLEQQRSLLNDLRTIVTDAETGQRGYLLTGNTAYLEPYRQAVRKVDGVLDALRSYYDDDPAMLAGFASISRPISRKLAEMEVAVTVRQHATEQVNWQAVIETDLGRQYMQTIHDGMEKLRESNQGAIQESSRLLYRNLILGRFAVALVSLLGLYVFYLLIQQSRRLERFHLERAEESQRQRNELEQLVRQRTESLTQLTTHVIRVQEEERGRVARELHDEMGALLTAAKLDTARIRSRLRQLEVNDDHIGARLQHLVESLNAGVAFKRQLIEDLQPSSLAHLGLEATLENYAREFGVRTDLSVDADIEQVSLSSEAALVAFRIVQEALTNIAKYAQASQIRVTLHDKGYYALLTVEDNGIGFDVATRRDASYGLPGMLHRVQAMQGSLQIRSAPGKGTRIEAALPQVPVGPPAPSLATESADNPALPPDTPSPPPAA